MPMRRIDNRINGSHVWFNISPYFRVRDPRNPTALHTNIRPEIRTHQHLQRKVAVHLPHDLDHMSDL